ncbi:MAG: hypothetical protein AAB268_07055 [Elusimicrobiota bacterium]
MKIVNSLLFNSRLQLLPDRPITLLAIKDRLLVDSFSERPYDSGCITSWDESELPWRFKHPEVAVAYRISTRLGPMDGAAVSDCDYQVIQSFIRLRRRRKVESPDLDLAAVFEMVLDYLKEHPEKSSIPEIFGDL